MNGYERNAFGIQPRTPAEGDLEQAIQGWSKIVGQLDELFDLALRDAAIASASARWQTGRPDPDHYVPGDVVALRAFAVSADLTRLRQYQDVILGPRTLRRTEDADVRSTAMSRTLLSLADNRLLFDAVPHFLDGDAAVGILASRPPDGDALASLTLPHPQIAVYFGRPLELGAEFHDWPAAWDVLTDLKGDPVGRTAIGDLRAVGGALEGVVLTEAQGGASPTRPFGSSRPTPIPLGRGPSLSTATGQRCGAACRPLALLTSPTTSRPPSRGRSGGSPIARSQPVRHFTSLRNERRPWNSRRAASGLPLRGMTTVLTPMVLSWSSTAASP